jgi:hypothetical protein
MEYNKKNSLQILVFWIFLSNIYEYHAQIQKIATSGINGLRSLTYHTEHVRAYTVQRVTVYTWNLSGLLIERLCLCHADAVGQ